MKYIHGNENTNGYKPTPLGWLPDIWQVMPIGAIINEARLGGNYANSEEVTDLPLIKMGNLGRGNIVLDKIEYVKRNQVVNRQDFLRPGDLLFNTRNTLDLVGKVAIWRGDLEKALFNNNILRLLFSPDFVASNEFMNYVFNSHYGLMQLRHAAIGTTSVAAIYHRDLMRVRIALPPLPEQRKITQILSTWDQAIELTEQLIAAKERRKRALMQRLLTGKVRFPGFGGEWIDVRLGDITQRVSNGFGYEGLPDGAPITRIETISNGIVDLSKVGCFDPSTCSENYRVRIGDILFSHINSLRHIGKVAFFDQDIELYHGINLLLIRPNNEVAPKYLYYLLASSVARRQVIKFAKKAINQASINSSEVKRFRFHIPRRDEQERIVLSLELVDSEIQVIQHQLTKVQEQKKGLMQQLLTGKKRVKVEE